MPEGRDHEISGVETDEAKIARQQARQMGEQLNQTLKSGQLEILYKQAGLNDEQTGLLGKVMDPNNTDEFVIMDSEERQRVIEIFGKLAGAPKIEQ